MRQYEYPEGAADRLSFVTVDRDGDGTIDFAVDFDYDDLTGELRRTGVDVDADMTNDYLVDHISQFADDYASVSTDFGEEAVFSYSIEEDSLSGFEEIRIDTDRDFIQDYRYTILYGDFGQAISVHIDNVEPEERLLAVDYSWASSGELERVDIQAPDGTFSLDCIED